MSGALTAKQRAEGREVPAWVRAQFPVTELGLRSEGGQGQALCLTTQGTRGPTARPVSGKLRAEGCSLTACRGSVAQLVRALA